MKNSKLLIADKIAEKDFIYCKLAVRGTKQQLIFAVGDVSDFKFPENIPIFVGSEKQIKNYPDLN